MFEMPANGLCKHIFLEISTFANQIIHVVTVADSCDVLCNDRALVEFGSYIMRSCSNDFYATRIRLMVRATACKGREKTVVNIDDRNLGRLDEFAAQHLHVTGKNRHADFVAPQNFELSPFRFPLRGWIHRYIVKRKIDGLAERFDIAMIRNDAG